MGNNYGWGMMGSWGAFGGLWMVLWWVLIIVGIVALVRWFSARGPKDEKPAAKALDLLKERYVRGELDRDTYEKMRRDLEH